MTFRERADLRAAIDLRTREILKRPAELIRHGSWYGYCHQRCRCDVCRRFALGRHREAKQRTRAA